MIGTKHYPFPATFREAMALPDYQFKSLFGSEIVESWRGLQQIEAFLRTHEIDCIFELGSGKGILTLYFAVWAWLHDKWLESYDASDESNVIRSLPGAGHLPFVLWKEDLFAERTRAMEIIALTKSKRIMLYCDIDPAVVIRYAPLLDCGNYVIVHAWNHITKQKDIQSLLDDGIMEFYERNVWESTGPHMGFVRC